MTVMRFLTFAVSLSLLSPSVMPGAAFAQAVEAVAEQANAGLSTPTERLDTLFAELKRENDPQEARNISSRIRKEWQESSGSPSINLRIEWADKAIAEDRNAAALDFLDEVVRLSPDYVEGWNRRATLHYKMGNYRKAMSDINRVLAIEPRHFGALSGMATILAASGREELALEAWQHVLDIYPSERHAQKQLGDLAEKLAGQRT